VKGGIEEWMKADKGRDGEKDGGGMEGQWHRRRGR
jgi:hypothetical protein